MTWFGRLLGKRGGLWAPGRSEAVTPPGPDTIQLREGSADFEWFIARAELDQHRDLKHGAAHLAKLLMFDPGNREWLDLLEQYLSVAGPDPENLIPRGKDLYASTEALRAYLWNRQGRLHEAIELLLNVTNAKKEAGYLEAWVQNWLEPGGAVEDLPESLAQRLFAEVLNRFPEVRVAPLPALHMMERWARLSERFPWAGTGQDISLMLRAGLLRKAGLFDRALELVRPKVATAPEWHSSTALGLILREQGDPPGADEAFRKALEFDPKDKSAMLEAGDTWLETEDWQGAAGVVRAGAGPRTRSFLGNTLGDLLPLEDIPRRCPR